MHRGGISYIRKDYITIPNHFLHPLNLHNQSKIEGLYYPTPKLYFEENIKPKGKVRHDFIFSPIPFDRWPFLILVKIRLKEGIGNVAKVMQVLESLGLNVMITDYHTVGHRFSILTTILEISEISYKYRVSNYYSYSKCKKRKKDNFSNYDKSQKCKEDRYKRLSEIIEDEIRKKIDGKNGNELKTKIRKGCSDALFQYDEQNEEYKSFDYPSNVDIIKLLTLPYHYWQAKIERAKNKKQKKKLKKLIVKKLKKIAKIDSKLKRQPSAESEVKINTKILAKKFSLEKEIDEFQSQIESLSLERIPFKAKIENDQIVFSNGLPDDVLQAIGIYNEETTTFALTNIHDKAARIRISIIPKEDVTTYKRISFNYNILGKNPTSHGYIAKMARLLSEKNIKILNLSNKGFEFEKYTEKGVIEFITQLPVTEVIKTNEEISREIETNLEIENVRVNVSPINPFRIFVSIVSIFFFRRQFIELCKTVGKEVGLLEDTFIFVKDNTNSTTEVVAESIRQSDGMLQFYIDFAKNKNKFSSWLDAEYLAAVAENKPIVRIQEASQDIKPLIDKDKMSLSINMNDTEEIFKNVIKEALLKLIKEIRKESKSRYG